MIVLLWCHTEPVREACLLSNLCLFWFIFRCCYCLYPVAMLCTVSWYHKTFLHTWCHHPENHRSFLQITARTWLVFVCVQKTHHDSVPGPRILYWFNTKCRFWPDIATLGLRWYQDVCDSNWTDVFNLEPEML